MTITSNAELVSAVENWIGDSTIAGRVAEFISLGEATIHRRVRNRAMEAQIDLRLEAAQDGGTAGGTANALTCTLSTAPTLRTGLTVSLTIAATNTSAATLNVHSTGAADIRKGDGTEAMEAGDLQIGFSYTFYYDGTYWRLVPRGGVPLPSRYLASRRLFLSNDPNHKLDLFQPTDFWAKYLSATQGQPKGYTIEGDFMVFGPAPDATYTLRLLYYRRPQAIASAVSRLFTENPDLYLYNALVHASPFMDDDSRTGFWAAVAQTIYDDMEKADRKDRYSGAPAQMRSDVLGA